jgi:hypothetical protein
MRSPFLNLNVCGNTVASFKTELYGPKVKPVVKTWGGRSIVIKETSYSLNDLANHFKNLLENDPKSKREDAEAVLKKLKKLDRRANLKLKKASLFQKVATFFRRLANLFFNRIQVLDKIGQDIAAMPLRAAPPTLLTDEEVEDRHLTETVHALCEMDTDGNNKPCSFESLKSLLAELKSRNSLDAINTIPSYYSRELGFQFFSNLDKPTPLAYWAGKGNLEAVKLLIEHGAVNLCLNSDTEPTDTSALLAAACRGHLQIVEFLLNEGADPSELFYDNVLVYFIVPNIIFHLGTIVSQEILCSLKLILEKLQERDPENLALQLRIPVDVLNDGSVVNALKYRALQKENEPLQELLKSFGATEDSVYSPIELENLGYNVRVGITLNQIRSLK